MASLLRNIYCTFSIARPGAMYRSSLIKQEEDKLLVESATIGSSLKRRGSALYERGVNLGTSIDENLYNIKMSSAGCDLKDCVPVIIRDIGIG